MRTFFFIPAALTLMILGLVGCDSDPVAHLERVDRAPILDVDRTLATYDFRAFDVPAEMGSFTSALGNNNYGTIVGNYAAMDGNAHGFLFRNGRFIDVTVPGSAGFDRGSLGDVNELGIAVGSFTDESDVAHAFVRGPLGNITVLALRSPDALTTEAYGINNFGTIVGNFFDAGGVRHGFIWRLGQYTTFDPPGAVSTRLNAVNDRGEIAGQYTDVESHVHGFILHNGNIRPVVYPGATSTRAASINNRGHITGFYNNEDGVWHGFIYRNGTYTSIDFPGSFNTVAFGINDGGVFVGTYDDFSFGYVATPRRR